MATRVDMDIVILALARWDGAYSSTAFSIAKELSKTNRVFYIDNPFTLKDMVSGWRSAQIRKRVLSLLFGIKPCHQLAGNKNFFWVAPPAILPINFLPPGKVYDFFSRINTLGITKTLKKIFRENQIDNFIFLNIFNPFYLSDIKKFNPACSVYYCVDNMVESKYIGKHGVEHERKIMRQFDFTISTSKFLQKYAATYSRESHYLPNAADFSLFKTALLIGDDQRPIELQHVTTKVVGYIGNVEDRIDFDLLHEVIKSNSDKCFLFIGPINSDQFIKKGFNLLPNVISSGKKNLQELPRYLRFIDCAIIPFKKNKLTEGIYPLKINEYLAAGRPVVCTSFSEDILGFKDIIQIADSPYAFSQAIQLAIETDNEQNRQGRIDKASTNTWQDRAEKFRHLVSNYS